MNSENHVGSSKKCDAERPVIRHHFLRSVFVAVLFIAWGWILFPRSAEAQNYGVAGCAWPATDVPVYFNPGTLAANGFNVGQFREAMINALAVWNEESEANIRLYYAGDTTSTSGIANSLTIVNQDTWFCANNALGKAFFNGTGVTCGSNGTLIRMMLKDSCTLSTRSWNVDFPGSGSTGGFNYEDVLVHEIGHAGFGFPDVTSYTAVMNGIYGRHAAYSHIYPIDVNSAVGIDTLGSRLLALSTSNSTATTWSTVTHPIAGEYNSIPPSISPRNGDSINPLQLSGFLDAVGTLNLRSGTPSTWASQSAPTSAAGLYHWTNVAVSDYNEILAVWVANCRGDTDCELNWGYSSTNGASWSTGTLLAAPAIGTFQKPEVAYDPYRDRFVVIYIDGETSRPATLSTSAVTVFWNSPVVQTAAPALHYLGGAVFDTSGTGLLVGARWVNSTGDLGALNQMQISSTSGGVYSLGIPYNFVSGSTGLSNYRTRRSFGLARDPSTGRIVAAWRGTSSQSSLTVARKTSILASAVFDAPTEAVLNAQNGVDVAYSAGGFTAAFTAY